MTADTRSQSAERRIYTRVPLDAPFFVTLQRGDGPELPALLVDFGRGGLQLALPPGTSENFFGWLNQAVMISRLPDSIDGCCTNCCGFISWVSQERCGVRFEKPLTISDDALENIVKTL